MSITTTRSVINVGTSQGVTLPADALKEANIKTGDKVDLIVRKHVASASDQEVMDKARDILKRYNSDFKNLAQR